MLLDRYFKRIGYDDKPRVDLDTLAALHRCHARAIPYENLDVQLGRTVLMDEAAAFDKLVTRRRGGWCYEMNGLLRWALREIGFRITSLAGAVQREQHGDRFLGNHLALLVHLDDDYLADVGFGDGLSAPIPLREDEYTQGALHYRLTRVDNGYWRFVNHPASAVQSFDFLVAPADANALATQSTWLQTAPQSPFVNHALCFIHRDEGVAMLRNRYFRRIDRAGVHEHLVANLDEYHGTLTDVFGLCIKQRNESTQLWQCMLDRESTQS